MTTENDTLAIFRAMAESSPTNLMSCDAEGTITYLNPASEETLRSIEKDLPISVDEIIGSSFDIFHKDPSYQQRLLKNPARNFPRRSLLNISEEIILDLEASALFDDKGTFLGLQAEWSLATERLKVQREADLKSSMVESAPINMMCTDLHGVITYINPTVLTTLSKYAQVLPVSLDKLVGTQFDIFHKDPSYQLGLLKDLDRSFPRQVLIDYQGLKMDLTATVLRDSDGQAIGLQACWLDVTESERKKQLEVETDEKISENASQVAGAATQLSAQADQMRSSVGEAQSKVEDASSQADSVRTQMDGVMSATEEMNTAVQEISNGAQEAASISNEAVETALQANNIVSALGDSSAEISNVIKAISSVAQQTNLLALNATIEAARAGEAGKGFAVVASEVKELAKETRTATEDITKKIEKIQDDTAKAVSAIESITEIINRLSQIANTTASSVEEQAVTTNEMSKNIAEANSGTSLITESMSVIVEQIEEMKLGINQNGEAANALGGLAEALTAITKSKG
jgi:methyl-accepting chemotaxis protein